MGNDHCHYSLYEHYCVQFEIVRNVNMVNRVSEVFICLSYHYPVFCMGYFVEDKLKSVKYFFQCLILNAVTDMHYFTTPILFKYTSSDQ